MPERKTHHFEFRDFDHAAIARGMGCNGCRVESAEQLRAALEEARHSHLPSVIDVPITLAASFRDATAAVATGTREKPWHGASE
jgi:acetolactate synthase-1/2/3 large subunit